MRHEQPRALLSKARTAPPDVTADALAQLVLRHAAEPSVAASRSFLVTALSRRTRQRQRCAPQHDGLALYPRQSLGCEDA